MLLPGTTRYDMSIISQLKEAVGMNDDEHEFVYNCRDCERTFESTESHMAKVACPDCGSHDIREIP